MASSYNLKTSMVPTIEGHLAAQGMRPSPDSLKTQSPWTAADLQGQDQWALMETLNYYHFYNFILIKNLDFNY